MERKNRDWGALKKKIAARKERDWWKPGTDREKREIIYGDVVECFTTQTTQGVAEGIDIADPDSGEVVSVLCGAVIASELERLGKTGKTGYGIAIKFLGGKQGKKNEYKSFAMEIID